MDKVEGHLEIGINEKSEVVINLDKDRTGHIVFSPNQARNLARILVNKAKEVEIQTNVIERSPTTDKIQHPKYGFVDKECIALCDAINKLKGLETTWSCCGHGKEQFAVFIRCEKVNNFARLLYVLSKAKTWKDGMLRWG